MIRNKPKSTLVNLKHGFAPIYFLNIYTGLPCTVLSKGKKKEEYVQMKECRVQREEAAAGTGALSSGMEPALLLPEALKAVRSKSHFLYDLL